MCETVRTTSSPFEVLLCRTEEFPYRLKEVVLPILLCTSGTWGWKYMSRKRVTQPSVVQELPQKAANLQAMAGAATEKGPFVKRNLERLAARFRTIAAQLAAELRAPDRTRVRRPGAPALYEGLYQELNSFGTPTGRAVRAPQGLQLPAAPHGFTWRLADRDAPVAVRQERRNRPSTPQARANTGRHVGARQEGAARS